MFLTAAQALDFAVFDGVDPCRDALLDGFPRAAVKVHRHIPLGIDLITAQPVVRREIADGAEFDLSAFSRLTWRTLPRGAMTIDGEVLRDNLLKASVLFDRLAAVPDRLAFRLRLPVGAYLAFQPPLEQWEKEPNERGGCAIRPRHVENSYAILTPSCKLGQLYRPFLRDAAGELLWIDYVLTPDGFEIPLTADAGINTWLFSVGRQWPVVLDPTFGDSDASGSTAWTSEIYNGYQTAYGAYTMAGEDGTLDSVSFYMDYGSGGNKVTLGVMNQASAGEPGTVKAACAEITVPFDPNWGTATAGSESLSASTPYWFVQAGNGVASVYYDTDATFEAAYILRTYQAGTLGDMTSHTNWTADRRVQAYGTYTATGGGTSVPVLMNQYRQRRA